MVNKQDCTVRHQVILTLLLMFAISFSHASPLLYSSDKIHGHAIELFVMPVVIDGVEQQGVVELARTEDSSEVYVDLEDFLISLALDHNFKKNMVWISTALGETEIPLVHCKTVNDQCFVGEHIFSEYLAMEVEIEWQQFAVLATVPWLKFQDSSSQNNAYGSVGPLPDGNELNYVRTELHYRHQNDQSSEYSELEMAGQLLTGNWQLRVRDYLEEDPYFDDYGWMRTTDHSRLLVGNQSLSLNPLLRATDFTGVQMAWANQGILPFINNTYGQQLINRSMGKIRSFQGEGIAGGLVELRVEGVVQAQTVTRLDGVFHFRDIEILTGSYIDIEAWVYAPNELGTPSEIIDMSSYNSHNNLPEGMLLVQAGIGVNGNAIEDQSGLLEDTFYLRSQYSFNDAVTLNGVVQQIGSENASLLGVRGYWGNSGYWQVDVAGQGGEQAWRVENINIHKKWSFRTLLERRPENWFGADDVVADHRFAELTYQANSQLDLSMIHRVNKNNTDDIEYTLPALRWRPHHRLSIQSRPDYHGDYRTRVNWRINNKQHLNLYTHPDEQAVNWYKKMGRHQSLTVQHLRRDQLGDSTRFIYRKNAAGLGSLGSAWGVIEGNGRFGYLAQLDLEWLPGLRFRLQVLKDPLYADSDGKMDTVIGLNVVGGFNVGGLRLTRGHRMRYQSHSARISGKITGLAKGLSAADVWVLVDGQRRVKTENDGQYTINNLAPGPHRVAVDLQGLPFEYKPIKGQQELVLSAGDHASVDFRMTLSLGVSGMIYSEDGTPLRNGKFLLSSGSDGERGWYQTDTTGAFRLDDMKPGEYTIQVGQACVDLHLVDQYILGKRLVLSEKNCEVISND